MSLGPPGSLGTRDASVGQCDVDAPVQMDVPKLSVSDDTLGPPQIDLVTQPNRGRPIDDRIVRRRAHWTESFRAVDWDSDGLTDLIYSLAGSHSGIQDAGSIYLLRNCGTKSDPVFEAPQTMRCFGEPIRITNHGPHPWPGDFDGDGKPDLITCVEWSVYPYYSHAALMMKERPTYTLELME